MQNLGRRNRPTWTIATKTPPINPKQRRQKIEHHAEPTSRMAQHACRRPCAGGLTQDSSPCIFPHPVANRKLALIATKNIYSRRAQYPGVIRIEHYLHRTVSTSLNSSSDITGARVLQIGQKLRVLSFVHRARLPPLFAESSQQITSSPISHTRNKLSFNCPHTIHLSRKASRKLGTSTRLTPVLAAKSVRSRKRSRAMQHCKKISTGVHAKRPNDLPQKSVYS